MTQKEPATKNCPPWTPEEVEELRRSLQTSDVAEVDTAMFGERFSEIIMRDQNRKKRSGMKRTNLAEDSSIQRIMSP
jgi:hypothetical protein